MDFDPRPTESSVDDALQSQPAWSTIQDDAFYRDVTSAPHRTPAGPPPSYDCATRRTSLPPSAMRPAVAEARTTQPNRTAQQQHLPQDEVLPSYSCGIHMEGVFLRKNEIENVAKQSPDRQWRVVYVVLRGTALSVHSVKRDWAWGRKAEAANPGDFSIDRPPWARPGALEKSYSLLHADAGIAADYQKRPCVIRVRAETEQFLLACVELQTFVKWLDALFASISVAAPIDDRDFPRDQSIPRVARRHRRPPPPISEVSVPAEGEEEQQQQQQQDPATTTLSGDLARDPQSPLSGRAPRPHSWMSTISASLAYTMATTTSSASSSATAASSSQSFFGEDLIEDVDVETGKWRPRHAWTFKHDMVYAKLCYAVLFYHSPRKSMYIVDGGKQWLVDWASGKRTPVQPPGYSEPAAAASPPSSFWSSSSTSSRSTPKPSNSRHHLARRPEHRHSWSPSRLFILHYSLWGSA